MNSIQCVVIGGGVIGLATAAALSRRGQEVAVLEKEEAIGQHASSRNSEVIHAGIYYPPKSLKARLCVRGRQQLYRYCDEHHIDIRRIGKLIVATQDSQLPALQELALRAKMNGVGDIQWLDGAELAAREPQLRGIAALYSPSTGIIDSHGLLLSLQGQIECEGNVVLCNNTVMGGRLTRQGVVLEVGKERDEILCDYVINAAGLFATGVAASISGTSPGGVPTLQHYLKSHYFSYSGKSPFTHLVYPVAPAGQAGIHTVLDLGGRLRFGPDAVEQNGIDYGFCDDRLDCFVAAIRQYYPEITRQDLTEDYTGISAVLKTRAGALDDFTITPAAPNGDDSSRMLNLYAMDSPALTSSLAIADQIVGRLLTT